MTNAIDELAIWLRAQIDDDERLALATGPLTTWDVSMNGALMERTGPTHGYDMIPGHVVRGQLGTLRASHIARHDPKLTLAEVDAKRRIADEHEPVWRTVEWPHDQDGKGHALVCRRCENADHSWWNPPEGQAGVLPDGFVTPYVLAPCTTLRLLALPYADRPGYDERWRP